MARRLRRLALVAVALLVALAPGPAVAQEQADPGQTTEGTVTSNGTEYPYLLYTPTSYQPEVPVPLVVVVHGCQTTARQEMELTLFNRLAEREGFVVLYPEVDEVGQQQPGPLNHCWRFFDQTAYSRGNGDPAAIAEMTRSAMTGRSVDAERVYLVGVSAGGLMAGVGAAAYSDIYAAVGIVASAGYNDAACFTTGVGIPVEVSAQLAHEQMGPRARVVPTIAIGSDADQAFPARCTHKALEQSLRTNNLVLSGSQTTPLALAPAAVRQEQAPVPGGLAYTVNTFVDPDGCLVGESWIIQGMPHAWPGGAEYGGYTDTRAPDGAEATWAFVERYRMSETSSPCAPGSARYVGRAMPPTATPEPAPSPSPAEPTTGADDSGSLPVTGGHPLPAIPLLTIAVAAALRRWLASGRQDLRS